MENNKPVLYSETGLRTLLGERSKSFLEMVGGSEKTLIRELSFAAQAVNGNNMLLQANKASIAKAVYNVATTGLSLHPNLGYAAIVPRYINKEWHAVLMPMYQGLVKLLTDAGSVKSIQTFLVKKEDAFEVTYGLNPDIKHIPRYKSKDITHVYAVATLSDGSKQFEVMTVNEVNEIREKSDAYKAYRDGKTKTCIWIDSPGEMTRKTVLRRIFKHLPKSDNSDRVANAFSLWDNDFKATDNQRQYIENLLHSAKALPDKTAQQIESRISDPDLSAEEAGTLINELQDVQPDPVTESGNYSQTQLGNHLDKLV